MAKQIDYTKIRPDIVRRKQLNVKPIFLIKELERLHPLLASSDGELAVECSFYHSAEGLHLMDLVISGQISVVCKRCLTPFDHQWHSSSTLQLDDEDRLNEDASDEQFERIPLTHDKAFNLMDVVVDEIVLGLPDKHPDDCPDVPELNYVN